MSNVQNVSEDLQGPRTKRKRPNPSDDSNGAGEKTQDPSGPSPTTEKVRTRGKTWNDEDSLKLIAAMKDAELSRTGLSTYRAS